MDCKYITEISPLAEKDLEYIFEYINNELKAANAAKSLMQKIIKNIRLLETMPEMCPLLTNSRLNKANYHKLIIDNFIMIYTIDYNKKKVYIIRAFYGHQNYEEYL